jgi:hypothetical protein
MALWQCTQPPNKTGETMDFWIFAGSYLKIFYHVCPLCSAIKTLCGAGLRAGATLPDVLCRAIIRARYSNVPFVGGKARVQAGESPQARVCLSPSADTLSKLLDGKRNVIVAYMTQKLKIRGDIALAMKLEALLR